MPSTARQMATLVLLLSFVFSTQGGLVVHLLFQLRQDYIAQHHCKNRFTPASKCNGMCFLKKRLAEAEEHTHDHASLVISFPVVYPPPSEAAASLRCPETTRAYPAFEARCELDGHPRATDPPPRRS